MVGAKTGEPLAHLGALRGGGQGLPGREGAELLALAPVVMSGLDVDAAVLHPAPALVLVHVFQLHLASCQACPLPRAQSRGKGHKRDEL